MVAGKPYIFDLTLVAAYEADLLVESAPSNLARFTDEEVSALWGAWMNRQRRLPFDPLTDEVGKLVCAEREARPSLSGAYTGRRQLQAVA